MLLVSRFPISKDGNVRFTTVPLIPLMIKYDLESESESESELELEFDRFTLHFYLWVLC